MSENVPMELCLFISSYENIVKIIETLKENNEFDNLLPYKKMDYEINDNRLIIYKLTKKTLNLLHKYI